MNGAAKPCPGCIINMGDSPPSDEQPYMAALGDVAVFGLAEVLSDLCPEHRRQHESNERMFRAIAALKGVPTIPRSDAS